jgi:NitT/TauT family transport system ATP-binding protein
VSSRSTLPTAIQPGQFVCSVGPSSRGKTTLLQMIADLNHPASGMLACDRLPTKGHILERGLFFRKDSVFPRMRVIDNVAYGLKVRGVGA